MNNIPKRKLWLFFFYKRNLYCFNFFVFLSIEKNMFFFINLINVFLIDFILQGIINIFTIFTRSNIFMVLKNDNEDVN